MKSTYKDPLDLTGSDLLKLLLKVSDRDDPVNISEEERHMILYIVYELKRGYVDHSFIINEWLKVEGITPPLQLIWALDVENLLKFTTYIYFNKGYCETLNIVISTAILTFNEDKLHMEIKKILTYFLSVILNVRMSIYFQMFGESILENILKKILDCFESNSVLKWQYLRDLKGLKTVNKEIFNNFTLEHMKTLLNHEDSHIDLAYTLGNHTKLWIYEKLPVEMKSFVHEVLSGLDSRIILNTISDVVLIGNFNWKYLLAIISVFIQQQKNSELLKGKVDEWLKSCFEDKNVNLLFISLIVARHCCAEKARYFNNYPTWFSSLNLKQVAVFMFFIECLTQIVPNEPPLFLKIHINKVPAVPPSCRKNLTEYITLCKTRLSDMNETTDYIGIFNDYYETDEEGQEADICRAIAIFQETKEIPRPLIEASVFRKQYYEKVFLKRLTSLPEESNSIRAELIKKLHSAGKIPNAIYNKWLSLSRSTFEV